MASLDILFVVVRVVVDDRSHLAAGARPVEVGSAQRQRCRKKMRRVQVRIPVSLRLLFQARHVDLLKDPKKYSFHQFILILGLILGAR